MFQRILIPSDFANLDSRVFQTGTDLARMHGAEITLLHVIELLKDTSFEEMKDFYQSIESGIRKKMSHVADHYKNVQVTCDQHIRYGNRVQEILRCSEERKIDLVLLQSHRIDPRQATEGWGTISYKVAVLTNCPVMLVK